MLYRSIRVRRARIRELASRLRLSARHRNSRPQRQHPAIPMINVAAIRMQQFGVQFYQASLTASDIDKLVRFEVLSYGQQAEPAGPGRQAPRHAVQGELGPAGAADRVEREGLPAPDHPPQDRRARPVLRAVPPGARSAVDSRRGDHFVRREAHVPARRTTTRASAR